MTELRLRPHHAVCLHFFEGKGYSAMFTEKVFRISESLSANADVIITRGADDMCQWCPKVKNGDCMNSTEITALDKRVMELCGFVYGERVSGVQFLETAMQNIIAVDKMEQICGVCMWSYICFRQKNKN